MARILVPMDGSDHALRALDQALRKLGPKDEIRLLNVQPPIPSSVGDFVGSDAIGRFHADEGDAALRAAKERLAPAEARHEVSHMAEIRVGNVADTIAAYAAETGCDEIVMGSRGHGGLAGMILGSVASRVLHAAGVPVTIVK